MRADTTALLADLGMDLDAGTPLHRLSLAQRQMVEIAKALRRLARQASSILVMDEPTSALTSREVDQLFALIERLVERGVAVVYITHRLDEVYRIGHRVTVLRDGRHVATHVAVGGDGRRAGAAHGQSRSRRALSRSAARRRVRELLTVDGLGRRGVLHDISFTLHAGEVIGIAGLLGAGRSELARVLAGADRRDTGPHRARRPRGSVLRTPADAIRNGIGLLPEDRKAEGLVAELTVARNIALPHGRRLAPRRIPAASMRRATRRADRQRSPRQGDAGAAGAIAERRQSAEGGARQVAGG